MANIASPLPNLVNREYGFVPEFKSHLFKKRLNAAKNLYRRDLVCHFGCVNAIEFSRNGELLVSGGDDRRVMLWQFGQTLLNHAKEPEQMKHLHHSNIFCLGVTNDNQKLYSGGNDDTVVVHDLESKSPLEVLQHQKAVCSLSIDPFNYRVVATAGNDGRLLLFDTRQGGKTNRRGVDGSSVGWVCVWTRGLTGTVYYAESLVISRSRKAFHGVMFHPHQVGMVVSANARDGVALWDLRSPKHPVLRYVGNNGASQNSMSVRFNGTGTHILALRRRLAPVLYAVHSPEPVAEFYHQDYYNSCTMKSCCFAGENDQYVMSGSDDFNLYMWKIPDGGGSDMIIEPPHLVLYGHRSIVNQVRYNPQYCLIASSGVEKIIKVWSALEYPQMRGSLLEEAQGSDNPREIYSHEDYVSLVHHSGHYISHNYAEQSTREDPRMMAYFDSLVQRELEYLAEETDSLDGSSSCRSPHNDTDSSDSDQIVVDFLPLPPKRSNQNGARSQRCPNRLARLVATAARYSKNLRSHKRGSLRRSKQSRTSMSKSSGKCLSGAGKRSDRSERREGRVRGPRRAAARTRARAPLSSERTDSDEPRHCLYADTARTREIVTPLRRRINLTRTSKRKNKVTSYRKVISNLRSSEATLAHDSNDDNTFSNFDNDENLALPSTSTGYRGQNTSGLFRIAEVDSDDDQSLGSCPISPNNQNIPADLVSIVPTPINGSRDSIGDSLRAEPPESESNNWSPPPERLRMNSRRVRRNGRLLHLSDSSESPPPKEPVARASTSIAERLSPRYNRTVARLMNETNESELESSCSTESSIWLPPEAMGPLDFGVGTAVGSSSRNQPRADDVLDDPDYQAVKFRQRVKKARRNYRNHMDSDSN